MRGHIGRAIVVGALAVLMLGLTGRAGTAPAASAGLATSWYMGAPYAYEFDSGGPSLPQVMSASGVKVFTLAFVLAGGGSCSPSWNGDDPVASDTQIASVISGVRAAGGDVGVSFGGYGGTKLGQVCASAQSTAAAEQQVVSKYGLKYVDFDLGEPEYENAQAIANELGAAQILQVNDPGLLETVTLPGTTTGTGWFGQQLLNQAKTLGYTPNAYSIMPFDGGFSGAASQIAALRGFNTMLMLTFGWSQAAAYAHEGYSGMNGRTDSAEYFYQADFQSVLTFAEQNGLGRFTFWDVNRDRACNPPDDGTLSSECSSVAQNAWDFTTYAVAFSKSSPQSPPVGTATPSSPASPTPSSGPGCSAPAWNATTVYTGGNVVSYNGHTWMAKWWTLGDIPGGTADVWADDGPCGTPTATPRPTASATPGPSATPTRVPTPSPRPTRRPTPRPPSPTPTPRPTPTATPATGGCTAPPWNATTAYVGGNTVTYNGHTWTAKWWTYNDVPGGAAGVWTDDGPCG